MMASPSELSLDCKPHSYSMLLKSFGEQTHDHTQKLEDFLSRLEEERLKIDAFKRELPLCMQLLTNAMEASRQQLQAYRANQVPRPVLEEFMPLKNSTLEGSERASNISDKANWMTSAQLWSQGQPTEIHPSSSKEMDIGFNVSPKLSLDSKQRNGGAFLPFSKERPNSAIRALPDLALASSEKEMELEKKCSEVDNGLITCGSKVDNGGGVINTHEQGKAIESQTTTTTTSQNHRKARRCWSPDLHRRFVNALQMLGGSQVATPKQIRELMKVDGLTNDEVKSHLQKYRLHTRRPGPSPQPTGTPGPQLVVLGGIWVPSEYAAAAAHSGGSALYGAAHHPSSHAMPPQHYCAPPQDHYYQTAPHQQLHHHTLHHQLHVYNKASSQTHTSPESDVRGTGDRSESIEDGKSESGSWNKGDSGENGGERRGLLALREDGEESINGSDITLKF